MNIIGLIISILLSLYIDARVFLNSYSPILIFWWIVSIVILLLPSFVGTRNKIRLPKLCFSKKTIFISLVIILPVLVRILNFDPARIHQDDLITAYFSATHDFLKINFFSGIPQDKVQWVAQFATPFFALQKIFFFIFGESLLSIKLSIMPYVFIISFVLFLIVKEIFDEKTAIISVILYSFFPISVYLETIGLHFISSPAAFIVFFYFAILNLKKNTVIYSLLSGISAGFCYLFYITSYIAFPMLIIFFFIQILRITKLSVVRNFFLSIIAFLIVLGPYLTYARTFNNYFTSRTEQVSLLSGSWPGGRERIEKGESPFLVMKENLIVSVKSLYLDGVGGHGGYTFGQLALFERFSLFLFVVGSILTLLLLSRKVELLLIIIAILASWATLVLSNPPPAYQRFNVAFPFITIIFSLPFFLLLSLKRISSVFRYLTIIFLLMVYILNNQKYFLKSTEKENYHIALNVSSYINNNFPNRNVYVASYPGFAFEKMYYFAPNKAAKKIETNFHDYFLKNFNPNEKYVYVIIFPENYVQKFIDLDPNGRIIKFTYTNDIFYTLFVN